MYGSAPSKQLMQKRNRLRVLDAIKRAEGITRPALARLTGLSLASITNIVAYLKEKDIVSEAEAEENERIGRKATLLRYNYGAYDVICVKVETDDITIALTDLSGTEKRSVVKKVLGDDSAVDTERLKAEIGQFVQAYASDRTLAVGIAVSGIVLGDGEYVLSVGLKWRVSFLKQQIEEVSGLPAVVFNVSASNALFGCMSTSSCDMDNVVFVDLDGGVGAIQLCKGKVNRAAIGEVGHTTVEKDGELCFCGNRGCLELMCSPDRIVESVKAVTGREDIGLADVFDMVDSGDAVRGAVDESLEYLGIAVANVISIFLPQKIIINYAELFGYSHVNDYVMSCVKRRVGFALDNGIEFDQIVLDDSDKLAGIAQCIIDMVFDVSFPRNIID